jgi:hypothetical protein
LIISYLCGSQSISKVDVYFLCKWAKITKELKGEERQLRGCETCSCSDQDGYQEGRLYIVEIYENMHH